MKVGLLRGSSRNDDFAEFAKEHNFTYHAVYFDKLEEMEKALKFTCSIDAIVTSTLRKVQDETILEQFATMPFYAIVRKDNTELLDSLNEAIDKMDGDFVGWRTKLWNTYYRFDFTTVQSFTADEMDYLKRVNREGKVFSVLANPDDAPYSFLSGGKLTGILPDFFQSMALKAGIRYAFYPVKNVAEYRSMVEEGSYDILLDATGSFYDAEMTKSRTTDSYYSTPVVFLYKNKTKKSDGVRKIAITPSERVPTSVEKGTLVPYATVEDCVEAVKREEVMGTYVYLYTAQEILRQDYRDELSMTVLSGISRNFAIAVSNRNEPELLSILSNVANKDASSVLTETVLKYTATKYGDVSFISMVHHHPFIIGFAILAIIVLLFRQHTLRLMKTKNKQLALAVDRESKASQTKSRFLSQMSHEIRTPMNAIVGLTTLARANITDPKKTEEYLEKIDISSKVLLGIINNVLDMSAIETGKLKIAEVEFDLKQVLKGISTIYDRQCQEKGIAFTLLPKVSHERLLGDSLRLDQILLNLVSNAYKFTEKGGITVLVEETEDEKFRFTVNDSGCGMSEEMQSRLFQPFEQEDSQTAQKYGGSGLGLSITKNLVELMGGTIVAHSLKGQGTSFVVTLPFKTVAQEQVNLPSETVYLQMSENIVKANLLWQCSALGIKQAERKEQATLVISDAGSCLAFNVSGTEHQLEKPVFLSDLEELLAHPEQTATSASPKQRKPKYDFKGMRVLLAEDNEINSMIDIELLSMVNVKVDRAKDGGEVVDMFLDSKPGDYKVILMDIQMPVLNGYLATERIRMSDHKDATSIPIYAMTANAFSQDVADALACGMNGHIAKPINASLLYRVLASVSKTPENRP